MVKDRNDLSSLNQISTSIFDTDSSVAVIEFFSVFAFLVCLIVESSVVLVSTVNLIIGSPDLSGTSRISIDVQL